ncbi:POTRA domain-containing protein [Winogradskyella thalassocola]|uniref:Surface antigen variable number repeat-containing protein n=1 Tax=Winogradskyella thalassocola TaxID=262004 RepID=A0A1G8I1Z2_9FLAO|nr:POTRA domain-containing protein [Winogradskyella thalassocola]SDI12822.1 Surface antigen variable number repeat-containing protein [Winogradskyella thalassocola]
MIFSNQGISQSINLKIIGENETSTKTIDSIGYTKTFTNYIGLQTETNLLKEKLTKQGFIDTNIEKLTKQNDTLFEAQLILGKRIDKIKIYYDSAFNIELLKSINYNSDDSFFELYITELETYLKSLNSRIAEQGDPFSTLQLINISKLNSELMSADLKVVSNQKRRIDKIIIKGYEKFPKSYVKHFMKLKTGKSFNLNAIKEKIELLNELRFASKIKDPEVLFTQDSTSLYLYVEKTRTNNFDGFLGFGTNENTNKIEFDGYLDLRLINNLNYGETLNLFYKSDEIDQQTFKVDADLPYLFSSPIGLQFGLNLFKKDSTFLNAKQYAKINYQVNAQHKVGVGITSTTSTNLLENDTDILNDYKSSYYTLHYNYTKPQFYDPLFPVNFWFDFSSGFGSRTNNIGKQKQNVFTLDTYKIFNLNNMNSIYTRLNGATLTSDNYLDNELFRFGGINSIRGFEENSLVANLYGVLSTEYRYRLSSTIYIHSVLDAAYFENKLTDNKEKLFGFGFGLGLLTNAGLFRLNYSSGKTENRQFKLSDSKVHLSLTATF